MKKVIVMISLSMLFAASLASAQAVTVTRYGQDSVEVLEAASHCPTELGDLTKLGRLTSAAYSEHDGVKIFVLQFAKGGMAPSFQVRSAGQLIITRSFQTSSNHNPDAPGGYIQYTCQIQP